MKWKSPALFPALICVGVTLVVCLFEVLSEMADLKSEKDRRLPGKKEHTPLPRQLEWMTYDWRVQLAAKTPSVVASNLGFIAIEDSSVGALLDGSLGYRYGLHWPRLVYADLVAELSAQGARAIGFDVLFADLRPDHPNRIIEGQRVASDEIFAREIRKAGNVVLAAEEGVLPPPLFRTNAWMVANIRAKSEEGVLRRARAFIDMKIWHPLIEAASQEFGWHLNEARGEPGRWTFPTVDGGATNLLIDANGNFDAAALESLLTEGSRATVSRPERAFENARLWHMGIVLASRELNLNLDRSVIDLEHGEIVFSSAEGVRRTMPVDRQGRFYIDWSLSANSSMLTKDNIEFVLHEHELRRTGAADQMTNRWAGKLVVVGSTATGNNLTDVGATPLDPETFLISKHWNVANSILTGRFVRPLGLTWSLPLIAFMGMLAAFVTLNLRPLGAVSAVLGLAALYIAIACMLYVQWRVWVPMVMPVGGSMAVTHVCLLTYLVRFEQRERRRTKDIFGKIVSPDVVRELLDAETLSLVGARRRLTVFFADVRGFTPMTDAMQQRAADYVARHSLSDEAATKYFDAQAGEMLATVNLYLGLIAAQVKKHGGTLDKYIGDCVMAFWGAPVPNPRHAVSCVHAVIEAQRTILAVNKDRDAENRKREEENVRRAARGEELLPPLNVLSLGSGINTGVMTVGLMGSDAHLVNYTVFGREVNLASRLESASGRGRILIGEATYADLQRDDPQLAATCIRQPPIELKGFREMVATYEVPWHPAEVSPAEAHKSGTALIASVEAAS